MSSAAERLHSESAAVFVFDQERYVAAAEAPLGTGRYGEVWEVRSESDGKRRAAKTVSEKDRETLEHERDILKALAVLDTDGFVVRAYSIGQSPDGRPALLMDLVEGLPLDSLARALRNYEVWHPRDEILRVRIATQISKALHLAYRGGIALTDIKLDNFFYDESWPQLIHIIDWNVVEDMHPREGFIDSTMPRLAALLYSLFTGLSIESGRGMEELLGAVVPFAQPEKTFWDDLTYETQAILFDMAAGNFTTDNPTLELWRRWERHQLSWYEHKTEALKELVFSDVVRAVQQGYTVSSALTACEMLLLGSPQDGSLQRQQRYWSLARISELLDQTDFVRAQCDLREALRRPQYDVLFEFRQSFAELGLAAQKGGYSYDIYLSPLALPLDTLWEEGNYAGAIRIIETVQAQVSNWRLPPEAVARLRQLREVLDFYHREQQIEQAVQDFDFKRAHALSAETEGLILARQEIAERLEHPVSEVWSAWRHYNRFIRNIVRIAEGDYEEGLGGLRELRDRAQDPKLVSCIDTLLEAIPQVRRIDELRPDIDILPEVYEETASQLGSLMRRITIDSKTQAEIEYGQSEAPRDLHSLRGLREQLLKDLDEEGLVLMRAIETLGSLGKRMDEATQRLQRLRDLRAQLEEAVAAEGQTLSRAEDVLATAEERQNEAQQTLSGLCKPRARLDESVDAEVGPRQNASGIPLPD